MMMFTIPITLRDCKFVISPKPISPATMLCVAAVEGVIITRTRASRRGGKESIEHVVLQYEHNSLETGRLKAEAISTHIEAANRPLNIPIM